MKQVKNELIKNIKKYKFQLYKAKHKEKPDKEEIKFIKQKLKEFTIELETIKNRDQYGKRSRWSNN